MMSHPGLRGEGGFSLVELLITIVIVGIGFAALLGGVMTSVIVSSHQREQATVDAVARSAAEWIKDPVNNPYSCAANNPYSVAALTVPSGYTVTISSIEYWTPPAVPFPAAYTPQFQNASSTCTNGLQRITIVVRSSDLQANETVQVIKRAILP
jgi:prepilin-type N-terminal cleavage/methylation domain-containing protein